MYFNFSLISHVVVEIFNLKAGGFIWQMGCALCGSVHVTGLTRIAADPCCTHEIVSKILYCLTMNISNQPIETTSSFTTLRVRSSMESLTSSDCNGLKGGLRLYCDLNCSHRPGILIGSDAIMHCFR